MKEKKTLTLKQYNKITNLNKDKTNFIYQNKN